MNYCIRKNNYMLVVCQWSNLVGMESKLKQWILDEEILEEIDIHLKFLLCFMPNPMMNFTFNKNSYSDCSS